LIGMDLNHVTLPALDVASSVAFYRTLGRELVVSAPHYARFKAPAGTASFSVHATNALTGVPQTVVYFECAALDAQVAALKARGVRFEHEPVDEAWLWREARLRDPSGNPICL
jgi:catechol 2,3-dioxygenase-like lactoylglutathione lyase family enzyme